MVNNGDDRVQSFGIHHAYSSHQDSLDEMAEFYANYQIDVVANAMSSVLECQMKSTL